jgi:mycoredoxin
VIGFAPYEEVIDLRGGAARPRVATITVYGTSWCAASQSVRRYLDRMGLRYRYVDIERSPSAARQLAWLTGGYLAHPTVDIDGEVLVEPSLRELQFALARQGAI